MSDVNKIIRRFEGLEGKRDEWVKRWEQCAEYVLPRMGGYKQNNSKIFDSTATLALGRCGAAFESLLAPRTMKWHSLVTGIPELDEDSEVAKWLEAARDILFTHRYAPEANFANQFVEALLSLCCLGTAALYIDDHIGYGLRYQCIPLHEVYVAENFVGQIDTVFRLYQLTARQALAEFGESLPQKIKDDAVDESRMEKEHEFIHAVFPRMDLENPAKNKAPTSSIHIAKADKTIVREKGYSSMPYIVSRFSLIPGDVYGRSPAMDVMPEIIQLNAMKKTILRAAEKMVDPPLLLSDDDILAAFSLQAGSLNFGGLNAQGQQMVVPLQINGNLPIGLELIEQARTVINEAFYLNLFQVLVEKPGEQTATEIMERAQEKAQLLAPVAGRQQSELLGQIIYREVDILSISEAFPALPEKMQEWQASVSPKYETAMAHALSSRDGQAILNGFGAIASFAELDPAVMQMLDAPQAARVVWQSMGAPLRVLKTEEEMEEIMAQQQQAEETAAMLQEGSQMIQGLEGLASAEEKISKAATYAEGVRGPDVF